MMRKETDEGRNGGSLYTCSYVQDDKVNISS